MSLRQSVKEAFLKDVLESETLEKYCKPKVVNDLNKLLIVDSVTAIYLKELIRPSDLTARGYIAIQNISIVLQNLAIHLIYFVEPTIENFKMIVKHFPKESSFLSIHIYASNRIPQECINIIKTQSALLVKLLTLKELSISFTIEAENLFTLGPHMLVPYVFSELNRDAVIIDICKRLTDLFIVLNDCPSTIRYMADSPFTRAVAEQLNSMLLSVKSKMPSFGKAGTEKRPVHILILNRMFDPRSLVVHDLTFESMARDLLDVKNNFIQLGEGKEASKLFLDDSNAVWRSLRYKHIADVMNEVNVKVKELTTTKKIGFGDEKVTVESLRKIVAKYPAYMNVVKFYQGLVQLACKLLELYKSEHIKDIAKAEQDLATNSNTEGESVPDNPALYVNLLEDIKSKEDKFRIIYLFALKNDNGIRKPLLDRLIKLADIDFAKQALSALEALDFPINEETATKRPRPLERAHEDPVASIGYEDSRFIPKIWEILKNFVTQNLDESLFPYLGKKVTSAPSVLT